MISRVGDRAHPTGQLADGESVAAALNSGYHLAYLIGAGLVLVAVAVSVLRSPVPEAASEPATEVIGCDGCAGASP